MTASTGFTTGIQVDVYYDAGFTNADPDYAALTHASNGLVIDANKVAQVRDIGDIEQNANNVEFGVYGDDTQKKVPGQASLGDFTFTYALQNDNTVHSGLANAEIGSAIALGIETRTAMGAATIDYILGKIGGVVKSTPIDEVAQVTITVAMEQKPKRVDQT